jgi:hypothetical protein
MPYPELLPLKSSLIFKTSDFQCMLRLMPCARVAISQRSINPESKSKDQTMGFLGVYSSQGKSGQMMGRKIIETMRSAIVSQTPTRV